MLKFQAARRTKVTVDDRRAVLVDAKGRKPAAVAEVPHEAFIRNALKTRLNWPKNEPASEELKQAAKEMGLQLVRETETRQRAERAARLAEEAKLVLVAAQ